jgi:hypothetical protein
MCRDRSAASGPGLAGPRTGLCGTRARGSAATRTGCRTPTRRSDPRSTEAIPPGDAHGPGARRPGKLADPHADLDAACAGLAMLRRARPIAPSLALWPSNPAVSEMSDPSRRPAARSRGRRRCGAPKCLRGAARAGRLVALSDPLRRVVPGPRLSTRRRSGSQVAIRCRTIDCGVSDVPPVSPGVSRYVPRYRPWVSLTVPGVSNGNQRIDYWMCSECT